MVICFIGGSRYSNPLDLTSEKKFRSLLKLGEIYVIGFSENISPQTFTHYAHFYLLPCPSFPWLRYFLMFSAGMCLALWCILHHKAQIVVAQSPYEGAAAGAAKVLARLLGRQASLIVENHGDFENSLFMQRRVWSQALYRLLMRGAARFALAQADALRAVSDSTRKQLEVWAPGKPTSQFIAWTDIGAFRRSGSYVKKSKEVFLLYAGVLIPGKGVHILLDAFAGVAPEFPDARLLIVGKDANPEYAASLKEQVFSLGLRDKVIFREPVSQTELAQYMARSEALILPSFSEALGRVVMEAMTVGIPVIGSEVGGIPELIKDGVTGFLVPPGDVPRLADRIRWVLKNPQEAALLGLRAKECAAKIFSTESYIQHYASLLKAALSGT